MGSGLNPAAPEPCYSIRPVEWSGTSRLFRRHLPTLIKECSEVFAETSRPRQAEYQQEGSVLRDDLFATVQRSVRCMAQRHLVWAQRSGGAEEGRLRVEAVDSHSRAKELSRFMGSSQLSKCLFPSGTFWLYEEDLWVSRDVDGEHLSKAVPSNFYCPGFESQPVHDSRPETDLSKEPSSSLRLQSPSLAKSQETRIAISGSSQRGRRDRNDNEPHMAVLNWSAEHRCVSSGALTVWRTRATSCRSRHIMRRMF